MYPRNCSQEPAAKYLYKSGIQQAPSQVSAKYGIANRKSCNYQACDCAKRMLVCDPSQYRRKYIQRHHDPEQRAAGLVKAGNFHKKYGMFCKRF